MNSLDLDAACRWDGGSGRGGRGEVLGPPSRRQLCDQPLGVGGAAAQLVPEIEEGIDAEEPTALGERVEHRGLAGALEAAGKQPVLATNGHDPELVLGAVVVDREAPVLDETLQWPPSRLLNPRLRGLLHPAAVTLVLLTQRLRAEHAALPVEGPRPGDRRGTSVASPTAASSGRPLPRLPPWEQPQPPVALGAGEDVHANVRVRSSAQARWKGTRSGRRRFWPCTGVPEGAIGMRRNLHGLAEASTPA